MDKLPAPFTKVLFDKLVLKHSNGVKTDFAKLTGNYNRWVYDKCKGVEGIPFEKLILVLIKLGYKNLSDIDLNFNLSKEKRKVDNAYELLLQKKLKKREIKKAKEEEIKLQKRLEREASRERKKILIEAEKKSKAAKRTKLISDKKIKSATVLPKKKRGRPKKEKSLALEVKKERKKHKSKDSWKRPAKRIKPKF